jgi:limonene-1,2-epoxide hydrolase
MTPEEVVSAFCAAAAKRDYDAAFAHLSPDVEYQNMPLPPVFGHQGVRDTLEALLALCTDSEWVVHRQLASGSLVMNERTDRFQMHGKWVDLPVAGVFEVTDGLITLWRDYFDLPTIVNAMTPDDLAALGDEAPA